MTAPVRATVYTAMATHSPSVVIEGAGTMWQTRIRCSDGSDCDFYVQERGANVAITHASALHTHANHVTDVVMDLLYDAWDEAVEQTAEWAANNPSPAGIPHDPPRNPYATESR